MPNKFHSLTFHVHNKQDEELREVGVRPTAMRGAGRPRAADDPIPTFSSDEAAARFYLNGVLLKDERESVRGLTAPERPEIVPDLRLVSKADAPLTKTRVLRFQQTRDQVPVFGSRAIVELDLNNDLVSISADFAEVDDISSIADLSPKEALDKVADRLKVPSDSLTEATPPDLTFYQDNADAWHLAYFFSKLPPTPEEPGDPSPQRAGYGAKATVNYLVDAHNGEMLAAYSATPTLDVPTNLKGVDEANAGRKFWGEKDGTDFLMHDPLRKISTYDLQLNDVDRTPLPSDPISNTTSDWAETNKAAVSAHANTTHVYDFYKAVLLRDGIDNAGMALKSVVNCTQPSTEPYPEWHNAAWGGGTMYYGQDDDDNNGTLKSWSRFLDIIAHELTHGVTDHESNLIYLGETGALNESFSDIFGVIIRNWYEVGPDSDVAGWDWEIGRGIRGNGVPLRDFRNPPRTNNPDHMDDFDPLPDDVDHGGVHKNSGIHNKAAYNVLSSIDENGDPVFEPREVAILYYLTLTRLSSIATFTQTLQELIQVASTFYAGDAGERAKKTAAIESAYQQVGISLS